MKLQKISVKLEPKDIASLMKVWPDLTLSQCIRLAIERAIADNQR